MQKFYQSAGAGGAPGAASRMRVASLAAQCQAASLEPVELQAHRRTIPLLRRLINCVLTDCWALLMLLHLNFSLHLFRLRRTRPHSLRHLHHFLRRRDQLPVQRASRRTRHSLRNDVRRPAASIDVLCASCAGDASAAGLPWPGRGAAVSKLREARLRLLPRQGAQRVNII
ncbi:hypothetical protein DFH11DRAFT_1660340, partial [Phellopilus nigrolimitatus]